ncbi:MAG: Pre-rRNA-processing protein ipi3 [Watsoniomyces obsoletus]|nr:MAG: Pre-rRNA-processing protein ipi3 [Watsoniomyces obsoletus]
MSRYISRLSLTPTFPAYTGPYDVGTVDVEIPVVDLPAPVESPDPSITTIRFRIFYPCEQPARASKPVRWLPNPQRAFLGAYARFMGANAMSAGVFSYLPNLLYHITIPVVRDAWLRKPLTESGRWPVMVFSHGLGGTRNSYSHFVGSIASHGMIVIAPEHRDGSAPISFIRESKGMSYVSKDPEKSSQGVNSPKRTVDYVYLPHRPGQDVEDGRNQQLRIRHWELGLLLEALRKIDVGEHITNLDGLSPDHRSKLAMFAGRLDIQRPGSIAWSGHSFGATTLIQLVKSVYYGPLGASEDQSSTPQRELFSPTPSSAIAQQITPASPMVLLDPWSMPLRSESVRWLGNTPLPTYAPPGPAGANVIAILSEAFFKWGENLQYTKQVLSPDPTSTRTSSAHNQQLRIFYPVSSAHLSQSDFGVLFPWLTKKLCNADEPERTLRLNVRAALQMLREQGYEVASTSRIDREEPEVTEVTVDNDKESPHDWTILAPDSRVRGWVAVKLSDEALEGANDTSNPPSEAVTFKGEIPNGELSNGGMISSQA